MGICSCLLDGLFLGKFYFLESNYYWGVQRNIQISSEFKIHSSHSYSSKDIYYSWMILSNRVKIRPHSDCRHTQLIMCNSKVFKNI